MAFTDDFTGTSGDTLESRIGWTRVDGVAGGAKINAANQLKFTTGGSTAYQAPDAGTANHYAQATREFTPGTDTPYFPWCTNVQDNANYVGIRVRNAAPGDRQLYKVIAGSFSQLASEADDASIGDTYKITRDGTSVTLHVNDTLELTGTVGTDLNTIQTPGLILRSDVSDPTIDNWESQEAAPGSHTSNLTPGTLTLTGKTFAAVTTGDAVSNLTPGTLTLTGKTFSSVVTENHISNLTPGVLTLTGKVFISRTGADHISNLTPGTLTLVGKTFDPVTTENVTSNLTPGVLAFTGKTFSGVTTEKHISNLTPGALTLAGKTFLSVVSGDYFDKTGQSASFTDKSGTAGSFSDKSGASNIYLDKAA